ncbi:MAG: disulfide bond formation protein DsbB [Cognaticolwellia sp.]
MVRLLGLVMLLIGLFIGIKVIFEAWHLYKEPQNIERFADAIEQGSHLDLMLAKFTSHPEAGNNQSAAQQPLQNIETNAESLRLTYFLAWIIAILLLMVIGSLASSAIRTGGQLALYDLQVKHFARQLITEARKTKPRG